VIRVETKVQRIIVALIVTAVLGLAYVSGALAADMSVQPPPDCQQMGKAPPDFLQMGKAPPDCMPIGMGKAPPQFLEMGKGKAPPPISTKAPLIFTKAPPAPPPPPAWTGFYIGGDAGAAWLSNSATWNPLPDPVTFGEAPSSGTGRETAFIGGAHIGYNDQVMPDWVVGIEGDWSWTKASATSTQPWAPVLFPGSETTLSASPNWIAAARGRLGYLVSPALMAYATGGAAWAKMDYDAAATNGGNGYLVTSHSSSTQSGYVAGGGVEWMMTDNWTVRAEYLYYQFAKGPNITATTPLAGFPSNFVWGKTRLSIAQAGLSYKF
jgi:outer membrane immunogenic protein